VIDSATATAVDGLLDRIWTMAGQIVVELGGFGPSFAYIQVNLPGTVAELVRQTNEPIPTTDEIEEGRRYLARRRGDEPFESQVYRSPSIWISERKQLRLHRGILPPCIDSTRRPRRRATGVGCGAEDNRDRAPGTLLLVCVEDLRSPETRTRGSPSSGFGELGWRSADSRPNLPAGVSRVDGRLRGHNGRDIVEPIFKSAERPPSSERQVISGAQRLEGAAADPTTAHRKEGRR
jgi:hypothetical protein